jgi:ribosomal protein S12 methylthiotransferase
LIGQDTTSYGEDLGLRDGLAALLARLADVQSVEWVRFLYAYPNRVTQRLLDTIAEHPRLVKYMDMPLQHASRNVLARMKRGSNSDAFLRLIEKIRARIPGVMLRTSFIAGFPGEAEGDFKELCDFVRGAEFDWMGVFAYSDVDTAASRELDGKVDSELIAERRDKLMSLQRGISARRLRSFRKQKLMALIEGPSKENELVWEARIEGMAPEIDGKLYLTDIEPRNGGRAALPGDMAVVEITKTDDYDLIGRVVEIKNAVAAAVKIPNSAQMPRIATGAPLRVLG